MAKQPQTTNIPRVPKDTPMFDGPDFVQNSGKLARTWIIFFERVFAGKSTDTTTAGGAGPYIRTLLLKDTTIGTDVADHVPIWVKSTAVRVIGVLRKTITADLVVGVKLDGAPLISLTIPRSTPVDKAVTSTGFIISPALDDLAVLSWGVSASDGSKDLNGIASVTIQFE